VLLKLVAVPIWVGDVQFGKRRNFQSFHRFGLIVAFDMIVTRQMQQTMDD
jgi:hypothetical protein